ncbi:hypothetical protein PENSUB_1075 [Penicillium subrubescens]|uniref:Uncharacterized protein n=1 Tax=Penicillium subrubescens TaxID=1316194 RepID=A0A1Q5ULA1_9EURO|nr:hypothetical protein PENSUB_1075 [Penicillium subrubescens]
MSQKMKFILSVLCIVVMLFTLRPMALGSVMKPLHCRTSGLYQRFSNLPFNTVLRSFSDCHGSELSGPSFGHFVK